MGERKTATGEDVPGDPRRALLSAAGTFPSSSHNTANNRDGNGSAAHLAFFAVTAAVAVKHVAETLALALACATQTRPVRRLLSTIQIHKTFPYRVGQRERLARAMYDRSESEVDTVWVG